MKRGRQGKGGCEYHRGQLKADSTDVLVSPHDRIALVRPYGERPLNYLGPSIGRRSDRIECEGDGDLLAASGYHSYAASNTMYSCVTSRLK